MSAPDRVINGVSYWWQGHYLVAADGLCPHGIPVEYRCGGCDEDYGSQMGGPRTVTR